MKIASLKKVSMATACLLLYGLIFGQTNRPDAGWQLAHERAVSMLKQGNYINGMNLAKDAVDLASRSEDPNTLQLICSLNLLADYYKAQNNFSSAEQTYRKALRLAGKTLGQTHPSLISALYGLGDVYFLQGQYVLAEPILKKTISLSHSSEMENHQQLLLAYQRLASLYRNTNRPDQAQAIEEASGVITKVGGVSVR